MSQSILQIRRLPPMRAAILSTGGRNPEREALSRLLFWVDQHGALVRP